MRTLKRQIIIKKKKSKRLKKGGSLVDSPKRVELLPDSNGLTGVHIDWGSIEDYDILPKIKKIEFPSKVRGKLNVGDQILEIQGFMPKPESSINPSLRASNPPNISKKPDIRKVNYCRGERLQFGPLTGFWGKEKCNSKMSTQVLNKYLKLSAKSPMIKTFLLIK